MSRAMVMLGAGITSLFVALPWSTPKAADLDVLHALVLPTVGPNVGPCGCSGLPLCLSSLAAQKRPTVPVSTHAIMTMPSLTTISGGSRAYPRYLYREGGPEPHPC